MKRSSEKKHWDDFWARSTKLEDVYGTDQRIVDNLSKYVDVRGLRVLEVGAGTGRDAAAIGAMGARVVALDYSEESLGFMRSTLRDAEGVVCGDATRLPFVEGSFDVVYHQGLLEHFRRPEDVLDENVRALKPGGVLLVDVPQKYHYYTLLKHAMMAFGKWFAGWETEFTVNALVHLVEDRGVEVVGVYGHGMSPPIWYRALRRVLLRARLRLPMYPTGPRWVAAVGRSVGSVLPERLKLNTALVIGCVAKKQ
jgi:ubiquinone/menaquinone biosynthesis C-methylase UbiE